MPDRGDIVWLTLDPTRGHEQGGRRPVLILSPKAYNRKIGLAVICPITSRTKEYAFEVPVSAGSISGYVLSDHVRSVDWTSRYGGKIGKAPGTVIEAVQEQLRRLLNES